LAQGVAGGGDGIVKRVAVHVHAWGQADFRHHHAVTAKADALDRDAAADLLSELGGRPVEGHGKA
jgi:hypothetical protein